MATDSARTTLADYGALIKRRRVYFLTLIPGTILLSVFLAYALPATYRAAATILLEPSSIPTENWRKLANSATAEYGVLWA